MGGGEGGVWREVVGHATGMAIHRFADLSLGKVPVILRVDRPWKPLWKLTMKSLVFVLGLVALWSLPALSAEEKPEAQKVPYTVHSGYFRRNDSGLEDPLHALVIADQKRFDQVFGVAFTMGAKPKVLPEKAFDTLVVCALIRQEIGRAHV